MKTTNVEFDRAQRGWLCRIWFTVTTANQFTDERHQVHDSSGWWVLAYWRARRAAKKLHAKLAARPGQRTAMGWAE